ncbi:beta-propeller domain-containing protein [Botrimarina sp.]|uniref:beta-propeller domain-containing protein n=1 Tax=Botrimarina sp. TaxID=2795802 RepID=UPI0032ECD79E
MSKAARRGARQTLRVEALEARLALDAHGATLLGDSFDLRQNGSQIELDVLANDLFDPDYAGERRITSVSYGDQGGRIEIAEGGASLLYTPPADFAGVESFVYAVDGRHTAPVSVSIAAPLADDRFDVVPNGDEVTLDVLANDPFWSGYDLPGRITSVSVGTGGGAIEIADDGRSIRYTAPTDPISSESFVYVVDGKYPARVQIDVPNPLRDDDYYSAIQGDAERTLNVLANDPFWEGYTGQRRITNVVAGDGVGVEVAPDGKSLLYTAPDQIAGHVRYDSIRYVVDGQFEATARVRVYRPVQDDRFEIDENSTAFGLDVLANDTFAGFNPRPPGPYDIVDRVTSVTQPENGTVSVSADGQRVLYTPEPGFTGTDTFTYTADGKHVASVWMDVTRPVRDDVFSAGVYQDTPDAVLGVLLNDFLGDGYAGPRVITGIGPTDAGGTVTIAPGGALLYTPAPGYSGADRFSYTVDGELTAEVSVVVTPLAQSDGLNVRHYRLGSTYTIQALANDYFANGYAGEGRVTGVELVSGDASFTYSPTGEVRITPESSGSVVLRYTVDGRYESDVRLTVASQTTSDRLVVDMNSDLNPLGVLGNDFNLYNSSYTGGARLVTGVSAGAAGGVATIAADGRSVRYTPPADYHGADSFTYTVDGFWTETVSVDVIRRVRDDLFRVDQADGQQALPVLVNDLFGADYSGVGVVTAVTASASGASVAVGPDGKSVLYAPAAGFSGEDTFQYTVDGRLIAEVTVVVDTPAEERYGKFDGVDDYFQFLLEDALDRYEHLFGQTAWGWSVYPTLYTDAAFDAGVPSERGHSETNVQVAGVDEGDIVEFDADYVYALTDTGVTIFDAWPAEELSVASRVTVQGRPVVEYLSGDRLTVISEVGGYRGYPIYLGGSPVGGFSVDLIDIAYPGWPPYPAAPPETIVTVFDVSDRTAPEVVQTTTMEGRYVDSRSVEGQVYTLVSSQAVADAPRVIDEDDDPETPGRYETIEEYTERLSAGRGEAIEGALPSYTATGPGGEAVRSGLLNTPETLYKPLTPDADTLISVVSIDALADAPGLTDTAAVYSTGGGTIYASLDNFYVFDADHNTEDGALTRIAKFDWDPDSGGIDFAATTTVPGSIINQFSADESGELLRIATSVSNWNSGNHSGRRENLLFVLGDDDGVLEPVGSIQNWALGESIRSVRFLGDRAFVTTARTIDPLFALDMSDPAAPEAVGHVTLPGFTSYLHLVDQDHLLAVGKNTPNGAWGPTQVSLFDISDLSQPVRLAEHTFSRFSTSEAEVDHHAFGYFAEHGLLGMPVASTLYEREDTDGDGYAESRVARRLDRLAVFTVDVGAALPADRLTLSAEVPHEGQVRRSGYIGDTLYSVGRDAIKALHVADLSTVVAQAPLVDPDAEPPAAAPVGWIEYDAFRIIDLAPANANSEPPVDPRAAAVEAARSHLAERLGLAPGAPLLVTAEATPGLPGGGEVVGFRAGGSTHWYRIGERGRFEPAAAAPRPTRAAWNAVAVRPAEDRRGGAGDFHRDGIVDQIDLALWRAAYGEWSLNHWLPADGNSDGRVDSADFTLWRDHLGDRYDRAPQTESPTEQAFAVWSVAPDIGDYPSELVGPSRPAPAAPRSAATLLLLDSQPQSDTPAAVSLESEEQGETQEEESTPAFSAPMERAFEAF